MRLRDRLHAATQAFRGQLYRSVLERMGFDGLLVPEQTNQMAEAVTMAM